jgi:hypothetical protein
MEKFIPFEKLSKKEKRKQNRLKRSTWGPLSPVTRRSANPKAYNRKKAQRPDDGDAVPLDFPES